MGNYNRTPNANCQICAKPVYRRPWELTKYKNVFCSRECYRTTTLKKQYECNNCKIMFIPTSKRKKFCSVKCSNIARRGINYTGGKSQNSSKYNFNKLKSKFNFKNCMVINCDYNITYDVHRVVEGKDGGKYEIGNMFAICPNCHAEVTRHLTKLEKIDNCSLRKIWIVSGMDEDSGLNPPGLKGF